MKIELQEFTNPEILDEENLFMSLKELEFLKKEIDLRLKHTKQEIKNRFGENYENDKWVYTTKEVISNRLDIPKIKAFLGENLKDFMIKSKNTRISVKLKK